ncbi:MAG: hypothetical protein Q4E75_00295 [bacterium]|nr:hypothetical protein [bacterium]
MSVNNSCDNNTVSNVRTNTGTGYIILIVLYILLAIILGSYWY